VVDTRRNLHQLLKGKQLYNVLYGVYTEMLHNLMAVFRESTAKGETAKTAITTPFSIQEFHEQRRQKWKPTDNADKIVKKPTTFTMGVSDPHLHLKPEVPTQNFFAY
jgi:hypothetical protein